MIGSVMLLLFFLLFFFIRVRRPKNLPSGPRLLPILGNLLQLDPVNPLKDLERLKRRYGNVFCLYIGSWPVVVLNGLEAICEVLVTCTAEFSGRPNHLMISDITECKGVIMADFGSSWRDHRRFALTTLRNFGLGKRSMEDCILEEVSHICSELVQPHTHNVPHSHHHTYSCYYHHILSIQIKVPQYQPISVTICTILY
ncbi:cytochrome P450 2D3-like [Salmo trutta]|uniref:cytochrome P450 2D3-like n=1 Tax=Salmo trutta TaxID=8032 RepID=UPI00113124AB|nr:cytochrome P450 2D3-like [Salmo trutta]